MSTDPEYRSLLGNSLAETELLKRNNNNYGASSSSSSSSSKTTTSSATFSASYPSTSSASSSFGKTNGSMDYPSGTVGYQRGSSKPAPTTRTSSKLSVDRNMLLTVLQRRQERSIACRSLPAALGVYCLAMYTVIEHGRIADSYAVETSLVNNVVYAGSDGFPYSVYISDDFYYYLNEEWIPAVLNTYDANGESIDSLLRGRISQYNLIVGGVRLTQTRGTGGECEVPVIRGVYGICHSPSTTSTISYGNSTAAIEYGVDTAFLPSELDGDVSYEFFLNPFDDVETNIDYGYGLQYAHWIDSYTEIAKIQLATVNGEVGFFGRVEMVIDFTRGGNLATSFTVTSIPMDPYLQYPWLEALDIFFLLYLTYLCFGTFRRIVKALRKSDSFTDAIGSLLTYFRLLDYAVVFTLLSCAILFGSVLSQLSTIRSFIAPDSQPDDYAIARDLQLKILQVADTFQSFKIAMVWLVIFLSARLFKYFMFQPRLATLIDAFSRAMVDLAHGFFVFAVILTAFGVWGHFLFGTQAYDWRDIPTSITSVIRFCQYDYDLVAMEQTYPKMADFYFSAMLLGVTNLTIWMFFGVVMETYSEVRAERLQGPTIWQETIAFLVSIPKMRGSKNWCFGLNYCCAWRYCCCCRRCQYKEPKNSPHTREATWAELIAALTNGPLKDYDYITTDQLRTHLGVSDYSARLLIVDVLSSKPDDTFYGYTTGNGPINVTNVTVPSSSSNEDENDDNDILTPEISAHLAKFDRTRSIYRSKSVLMNEPLLPPPSSSTVSNSHGNTTNIPDNMNNLQAIQNTITALSQQLNQLQATLSNSGTNGKSVSFSPTRTL